LFPLPFVVYIAAHFLIFYAVPFCCNNLVAANTILGCKQGPNQLQEPFLEYINWKKKIYIKLAEHNKITAEKKL
jgi:hypothetical protein